MAVTVITRPGKSTVKIGDQEKKVKYTYQKVVTPDSKRGLDESVTPEYPTLSEFVEFIGNRVEYELDPQTGKSKGSCLLSYAIDGFNLESNQNAAFRAANTPDTAAAKIDAMIDELLTKFPEMTREQVKGMLR